MWQQHPTERQASPFARGADAGNPTQDPHAYNVFCSPDSRYGPCPQSPRDGGHSRYEPASGYGPGTAGMCPSYTSAPPTDAYETRMNNDLRLPHDRYLPVNHGEHASPLPISGSMQAASRGWRDSLMFSAAAIAVMAFVGALNCFFTMTILDSLEFLYVFFFSMLLVIDNTHHKRIAGVLYAKAFLRKYADGLSRVTFKGSFLCYLGSALVSAYFGNAEDMAMARWSESMSSLLQSLGGLAGGVGFIVGILVCIAGTTKTRVLHLTKERLVGEFGNDVRALEQKVGAFMNATDERGRPYLGPQEFHDLCASFGFRWSQQEDLMLIFNALSSDLQKSRLYMEDIHDWTAGVTWAIL